MVDKLKTFIMTNPNFELPTSKKIRAELKKMAIGVNCSTEEYEEKAIKLASTLIREAIDDDIIRRIIIEARMEGL